MARKPSAKAAPKAAIQNADPAAASAAPAAAEQLATQPAAPTQSAAPAPATPPASTEQPMSEAPGLDTGSSGQDAQPHTDQAAAGAAATTSQPASAAPEEPLDNAAETAELLPYPTGVEPGVDPLDQALADVDGKVEGLWITAIPEQGFRRCGYRFTREGFGIALSALTTEQIETLEREPNLKVERGVFSGLVE